jgi:hypothetical protein
LVRNFRIASLRGWEYALQHPDEIAGRIVATLPHPPGIADAAGFAKYQTDVARRLSRYPDIPLGHSNPDRWNRIEASLFGAGALLRTGRCGRVSLRRRRSRTQPHRFARLRHPWRDAACRDPRDRAAVVPQAPAGCCKACGRPRPCRPRQPRSRVSKRHHPRRRKLRRSRRFRPISMAY